jgi:hypothetical protein
MEEETGTESVVLGPQEIDAVYRPNVSFVGIEPDAKSPSEMSDAQRLQTPEGQADIEKAAEEVAGGEVEKKIPSAGEKPSGEKEVKLVEKTAEDEKDTKNVQKRINKITFEKHEAIRRAEHAEAKLKERDEELRKASTERAKAEILSKKPNETDFESEAEYYEALGRWSTRSEMLEIESERTPTTNTLPAPSQDLPPEVQAMLKMGSEMYDDFDDAVSKAQTIPQNLVEEAMDTKETAHDIIYYLAKNQDEAVRIAQLSPKAITREIGKIEAGLSAPTPKTETIKDITEESVSSAPSQIPDKPIKPKQTTNAPPPITPIKPGAQTTTPDQGTMTNKEYRASRGFTSGAMRKRD